MNRFTKGLTIATVTMAAAIGVAYAQSTTPSDATPARGLIWATTPTAAGVVSGVLRAPRPEGPSRRNSLRAPHR